MAKNNNLMWLVVIVALIFMLGGSATLPKVDLSNFLGGLNTGMASSDLVDVHKVLEIALKDDYAGSALTSKTLDIYDSDGETPLETGLSTGSDGTATSADPYPSGKVLYIRYESSNDKMWWQITVPQMLKSDAESATVNHLGVDAFAIGTYTASLFYYSSTAIADGGSYNFTANSETPTFTYTIINTGSDNTGLKSSHDPVYKHNWDVVFYVTFSGTDYEKVLVYNFGNDYTLGTTHYVASTLDPYALTKHKVGNTYKSEGQTAFTFSLDGTGYTSSGSTTMQLYIYAYSDPVYNREHGGAFGVESVQLDEITVTLQE